MQSEASAGSFDFEPAPFSRRKVLAHRMRGYEVALVEGLAEPGAQWVRDVVGPRRSLVVTTPTVAALYGRTILQTLREGGGPASLMVLSCNESNKSLDQVIAVCDEALRCGLDRKAVLVGIGGGVCTDIVTMAASWIRRGIDYVKVPTTLIGLVDSGLGIKGAVNFEGKKSYLGCFYPPESVLLDPSLIRTLPARHVTSGIAEIIKTALLGDRGLFELVERHWQAFRPAQTNGDGHVVREIVWRATVRLIEDLETNLHEDQSRERAADLGHTFSPALESASGFTLAHGEAVAVDLALSAELATRLGFLEPKTRDRTLGLLRAVGLPVWHPALTQSLCSRALEEAARHRGGRPNLVLPAGIGEIVFVRELQRVPAADLEASIGALEAAS